MRATRLLLLLVALPLLGACAAESPFSLVGKPKLAGRHCSPPSVCSEAPVR